ncbi:MAG: cob(I)yrinic acid a,c-diamide adenosyltransferase [Spirochaetales bacterium]
MKQGYVQVYTGDGKGKTTAALGLCLRALGAGLSVYIGQFIKGMKYSEILSLEKLSALFGGERLTVEQYGRGCFIKRAPEPEDIAAAGLGLQKAMTAMLSGRYDLVILDEINVASRYSLISDEGIAALLDARPASVELVMTGRYAPASLIARADLVTEMKEIRHYYAKGVEARRGIER